MFFRITRFGQLILSWLQPFAHPPQRRMGTTGEDVAFPEIPDKGVGLDEVEVLLLPFSPAAARFFRSDHVRSSFSSMYLPLAGLCFMTMNSQ